MLVLCKTPHALEEESATAEHARELGMPARGARCRRHRRARARHAHGRRRRGALPARLPARARSADGELAAPAAGRGREVSLEHDGDRLAIAAANRIHAANDASGEIDGRRVRAQRGLLVAGPRARPGREAADAGGQGLQPHAAAPERRAAHGRDPRRGAHGGDADGRRAALRRHDGARRPERGHQSDPRARHHRRGAALLPGHQARRISTASGPGAGCVRARPTACPTSAAPRATRTWWSPPATP